MYAISVILGLLLIAIFSLVIGVIKRNNVLIKILFMNSATILATLFICTLGSIEVNSSYLDIAIIYFLLSYIASLGYLRYFLNQQKH